MSLATLWHHLVDGFKKLWAKEPQIEKTITDVISGLKKITNLENSVEADVLASVFPNGVGNKTLEEVRKITLEVSEVSTIAASALKASESLTDPKEKANAVITLTLTEVAKLPGVEKEARLLNIIASYVSKLLHISFTEASTLVGAKMHEMKLDADAGGNSGS